MLSDSICLIIHLLKHVALVEIKDYGMNSNRHKCIPFICSMCTLKVFNPYNTVSKNKLLSCI